MKKFLSKSFAMVLAALVLFGSSVPCFAAEEHEEEAVQLTDEEIAELVGDELTLDSEYIKYEEYRERNGALKAAKKSVSCELSKKLSKKAVTFTVEIPKTGYYNLGFSYKALTRETIMFSVAIDDEIPFAEAEKMTLYGIYENDKSGNRVDGLGNEFAPKQVLVEDYYFDTLKDITKWSADDYYFYLSQGEHTFTLTPAKGSFQIESAKLAMPQNVAAYAGGKKKEYYTGDRIVIEGESAVRKTSYWLAAKSDNSSLDVTPNDAYKTLANYIGGGNWKTSGETIEWETPEMKAGYYRLGFCYRQSAVLGAKVYRTLRIDGEIPFRQAASVGFGYSYDWQQSFFADDQNRPYLVYIPEGKHTLSLTVVPGEVDRARDAIKDAVAELGELYVDITMITGETVDIYRDYNLFEQVPDMQKRLKSIYNTLKYASEELQWLTGENSGSYISVINNMMQICKLMYENRFTAHRYKSEYYSKYTSLASVLYEMSSMPLDLDKLVLCSPNESKPFERANFFRKAGFSAEKFVMSFVQDYNNISGVEDSAEDTVTIWVNWGRDQAQVLNSLIQTEFTPKEKISVNLQLVNASVVQAILSGKGPDCLIQHSRSEPVNLAMRGMLYDLKQFDDCDEVLKNFHDGAELPYYYKDGLYGLPDTQQFYMLFYRTDLFEEMNLEVPETWDDFEEVAKLLARNNLTAWLPNNTATSVAQANIGIGSINLFPSLLLQRGLEVYAKDGKATNLTDSDVAVTFNDWADMYSSLKLPRTLDFYNRFRTGTCPIGVSTYTLYTTLKAAAPEIDGLWDVALVPGTKREDGMVDHTTSGGGSACSILKLSKNPENAWKFLRWWVSDETQLAYSSEVESILGPTGRVSVSNVKAFKSMEWDEKMQDVIFASLDNTKEIPEYPGSYYVSRSVYQAFWNVVENNQNPKDTLLKFAEEADREIARKWKQYENR